MKRIQSIFVFCVLLLTVSCNEESKKNKTGKTYGVEKPLDPSIPVARPGKGPIKEEPTIGGEFPGCYGSSGSSGYHYSYSHLLHYYYWNFVKGKTTKI